MSVQNFQVFRLRYAGKFEACEDCETPERLLEYFSVVSILAIYIAREKRLYIWVGSKASDSLKNYIAHVRAIFSRDLPELRVIRNITIECKFENPDFFESLDATQTGISKEQLHEYIEYQETKLLPVISKIDTLKKEADELFLSKDYLGAIEASKKIIALAEGIDDKAIIHDQEDFINEARNREREIHIEKLKQEMSSIEHEVAILAKEHQFNTALLRLDKTLKLLEGEVFAEEKARFETKKQEILENKEIYETVSNQIIKLEEKITVYQEQGFLNIALSDCQKLIALAEEHKREEIKNKYMSLWEELKHKIATEEAHKKEQSRELMDKAKELTNVLEVDDNVLPLVDEFSVSDILGNLSSDVNLMLEQIGSLLDEHRVEIKNEITNKMVLKSTSGEVIEHDKLIDVTKTSEEKEDLRYIVQSGIENPYDDLLEEAIITDLIPYNFEITNIVLEGEVVKELPDKTLTKEGIELKWQLQNVPPKKKIEIDYNLRRRVSRTIIFILEGMLKIIKTHSNLETLQLEGLFEAKMPFNNAYGQALEGLVVEDIIPLYYINFIKKPQDIFPADQQESRNGEIIKWNIGSIKESGTLEYNYRLLEIYKHEELKIKVNNLCKKIMELLEKGEPAACLPIYNEVINNLEEYQS
ncbi:MAG: hypothetical protein EU535_09060 [Promethearchaeota archaeon]|nr:MAG: hypothetical protein EU535_09060 [Candidatus Lokiarchaeota archaeon]